ncbi:MAG: NUDIX hydrolase [Firmicutes bacterium]|nr:NUDIX hydrolase [Bacillota bacterium]
MNYCSNCGRKPESTHVTQMNECPFCTYVDWNNWVNVSCVVVAYNHNNEFLMIKLKGKEEDKLTFPGGYRDLGETLEEAAKREFFEETGMAITQLALYKTYTKDEQRLIWVVYKTKITDVKFVDNDEVKELLTISEPQHVDSTTFRGELTEKLFYDLIQES